MVKVFTSLVFISIFTVSLSIPVFAGTRVISKKTMSFNQCLATIRSLATKLGVAPVNIVETNILRMVRFQTNDGSGKSYLLTCSKPDRVMQFNESW